MYKNGLHSSSGSCVYSIFDLAGVEIAMAAKLYVPLLVALVAAVLMHSSNGAPRPSNTDLLEKNIADYLRHDKELVNELKQLGFEASNSFDRVKRQSDIEIDNNGADYGEDQPKEPGFFDRAAKFVVELLQRFLRWINTENS